MTISVLVVSHVSVAWGAQRRLLDLGPRLVEHGIRLTLASPPGHFSESWQALGLPVRDLVLPEHRGLRTTSGSRAGPVAAAREAGVMALCAGRIARLARGHDVLHSHSLYAHPEVTTAGRLTRRPVVLDLHDIVVEGAGRRLLQGAARLASVTIANSGATRQTLGSTPADRVAVIHPGVDTTRFRPGPAAPGTRRELSARPDAPLVGILGRLDREKGIEVVVEAVAKLGGELDVAPCLAVVGAPYSADEAWAAALTDRARDLAGDRVRFVGARPDPDEVLRGLDVLVNASDCEPFGRTVLEAQASGVPVIGTDAGGIPEFVAEGETGLLVPPRDPSALARALARVLQEDELRGRIVRGGLQQATGAFSVEQQVAKVAAVYHRLGGGR